MLAFALRTLRFRAGMFVAAFLAMFSAAAIMMACGGLIETSIRTAVPPRQLASADVGASPSCDVSVERRMGRNWYSEKFETRFRQRHSFLAAIGVGNATMIYRRQLFSF